LTVAEIITYNVLKSVIFGNKLCLKHFHKKFINKVDKNNKTLNNLDVSFDAVLLLFIFRLLLKKQQH